ncbi:hypothetical protein NLX62_03300 [Mycobacteriaceae bacterium Msp059]|nr:hypothetical protein [Mycobacteriaceae bacterium Msp059]
MRVNRRNRLTPARSRRGEQRANPETAAQPETVAEPVEASTPPTPEPPRREHLYGSTYRVRMSFDELMATRGYLGEQVLAQRRRTVRPTYAQQQRNAALNRAGYRVGEVVWPSD